MAPKTRPPMAVEYPPGTVRMRRWHGEGDIRAYQPPQGWKAVSELLDIHPISRERLTQSVWWIIETRQ